MKVKELLISEDAWTTQHLARDVNGESTFSNDSDAVCWCLVGAICKCYGTNECKRVKIVIKVENYLNMPIHQWNDKSERTFDDVKNLIMKLNI